MATDINDFVTSLQANQSLMLQEYDENTTGATIDLIDGDGPTLVMFLFGGDDPVPDLAFVVQQSADTQTWSTVPLTTPTDGIPGQVVLTQFQRAERYVRVNLELETPVVCSVVVGQQRKLI